MSKKQPTRGESLAKAIISEYKLKTVEDKLTMLIYLAAALQGNCSIT